MIARSLFIFLSLFFLSAHAEFIVPKLTQPVIDKAGMIPVTTEKKLSRALKKLYQSGGSQIQVLVMPDLNGLTIEQASIKVTDQWKLGREDKDNGVLLLVAQKERKIRIEVGQGLEGDLTDAYAKRIIREVMVPLFRSGHADSGILLGVVNIAKYTDPNVSLESAFDRQSFRTHSQVKKKKSLASRIFSFLIFLFMLFLFIRNPSLFFLLLLSGGRGGHYGGGSSGGGGGWSGGGGGFSGGGASGGW